MRNGWTGGQYSLFRTVFGAYLFVHFAQLIPWSTETFSNAGVLADRSAIPLIHAFPNVLAIVDNPPVVFALIISATVAALFFAVGKLDRISAIWMWYILACLFGRNPLTANPSLPFVGWMLIAHCFLPTAPAGSLAAAGRTNPGNQWKFPEKIFLAAWIIMAASYSFSGYTKLISPSWLDGSAVGDILVNPLARDTILRRWILATPEILKNIATWGALGLELLFAPLALLRILRPGLWTAMLMMHLCLLAMIDFADLSLGMIMIHLFTFDPAWIRGWSLQGENQSEALLFYDGHCGLCHGVVRFVLAEDCLGRIRFAPLQSKAIELAIPDPEHRASLPDSIALRADQDSDTILVESDAMIRLLTILGGYWRLVGALIRFFPRPIRDAGYRIVAKYRRNWFSSPPESCPLVPSEFRNRFDLD